MSLTAAYAHCHKTSLSGGGIETGEWTVDNITLVKIGWNAKLGPGVASLSLPVEKTCPGKSIWCSEEGNCYALRGPMRMFQSESYEENLTASMMPDFVERVVKEIKTKRMSTVRLHVSGDFYSPAYVKKWIAIARACPHTQFYGYTRSWRLGGRMLEVLEDLRAEPNVVMYASMDDTIHDTLPVGWLTAWTGGIAQLGLGILCPNSVDGTVTCTSCGWCPEGKGNVVFPAH